MAKPDLNENIQPDDLLIEVNEFQNAINENNGILGTTQKELEEQGKHMIRLQAEQLNSLVEAFDEKGYNLQNMTEYFKYQKAAQQLIEYMNFVNPK